MARLKTWADRDPFTAADANSLAQEVPPTATAPSRTMAVPIYATAQFDYGRLDSPGMTVRRQGLLVTLSGDFRVRTANWIGAWRRWGTLEPEFRPPAQAMFPVIGMTGGVVMLRSDADGSLWVAGGTGIGGTHVANFEIFASVVWVAAV